MTFLAPEAPGGGPFGRSLASLRSFGGASFPIVALGAPDDQVEGYYGLVYVYSVATGALVETLRSPLHVRNAFGRSLCNAGDLDRSGFDSLLVGAPLENDPSGLLASGAAYLLFGNPELTPVRIGAPQPQSVGNFGNFATAIPDLDADGVTDLGIAMAAPNVFVFSGASHELRGALPPAGSVPYNGIFSICGIPDVNGDGAGDVLVDASRPPQFHFPLTCFSGATGLPIWEREFPTALFSLSSINDMDGDGVADIVVGCPNCRLQGQPPVSGAVWLLSGATGETIREVSSPSPVDSGAFGYAVLGFRDLDGDLICDFVVGAQSESAPGAPRWSGLAYVLSGRDGTAIQVLSSPRPVEGGLFGNALTLVPDINGDGRPEVAIGAWNEYSGEPGRQAYLFLSCRADYNADSRVDSQDFFAFLSDFFADHADFNRDGIINSQDFFDFLAEFFTGC